MGYAEEQWCGGCGKPLLPENYRIADGCPCNSQRGVNHNRVPVRTCTCDECDPGRTGSTRYEPLPEWAITGTLRADLARVTAELAAVRHNYGMSIKGYEADLAIYREVLNYAPRWFSQGDGRCDCGHSTCWWCKRWEALSIHAGRSLLSRLEALEAVAEAARGAAKQHGIHSSHQPPDVSLHDALYALDALEKKP